MRGIYASRVRQAALALILAALPAAGAESAPARVQVEEFTLDNGMKFLLVRRPEQATVMGGWVAGVGSANERPGITGVAQAMLLALSTDNKKLSVLSRTQNL